jgi:class 3 adenylate cyclase
MPEASASRSGASSSSDNRGASSNSDGALEPDEDGGRGRVTAIGKDRLQTFNFQQATKAATSSGAPDAEALSSDELQRYISSVLRFVPVEVAMRYYEGPLTSGSGSSHRLAYSNLRHANCVLGEQGYEHPFDACVLFSDISGFTKLTNRLLKERGDEGAEILNNIICRFFEELISIITRHAGDVIKFAGDAVLSIWSSSVAGESIQVLTQRAVACALEQVERLHGWDTGQGVKLELHLGLGTGPVKGVDLGNHMRREFVVAGEPLKQLSEAEQQASSGQLVVSPAAWELVASNCSGAQHSPRARTPLTHLHALIQHQQAPCYPTPSSALASTSSQNAATPLNSLHTGASSSRSRWRTPYQNHATRSTTSICTHQGRCVRISSPGRSVRPRHSSVR